MLSFLICKYIGMKWFNYMACAFKFFKDAQLFLKVFLQFTFPTTVYEGSNYLSLLQYLVRSIFLILAVFIGMQWLLIVPLIFFSVISIVQLFRVCCVPVFVFAIHISLW